MSEEPLNNEIAIVNGRIDIVEEEIASVVTAVADAEGHVLNKDNPSFWEPKLLQLRRKEEQLRRKEEQLRDLVLLKEQQRTAQGGGGGQAETADERFIRLLGQTDTNIEAHVLAYIHETGELSSRMVAASTPDQAVSVYKDAERIPQSHTRADVLMTSNIRLDGPVPMHGVLKAMFIYAFEENVPLILKVPNLADSVGKECSLFARLSDGLKSSGRDVSDYALVPVKFLKLRGGHTATRASPLKTFNCGILMPIYCMSLDKVPVPIPPLYALQEGKRLLEAVETIHSFGWMHGDIKPHNIFLSNDGRMWLGDYGSSCEKSAIKTFSGGTLRYQCSELHLTANNTLSFDIMGLLLSLLDRLGVIELESGPVARNKIMDSINAVTDEELQHFFEELYRFTME